MTQKQIAWIIVYIVGILAGIFMPYEVGKFVGNGNECPIITWFIGVFTMAVVIGGIALCVVGYELWKKKI